MYGGPAAFNIELPVVQKPGIDFENLVPTSTAAYLPDMMSRTSVHCSASLLPPAGAQLRSFRRTLPHLPFPPSCFCHPTSNVLPLPSRPPSSRALHPLRQLAARTRVDRPPLGRERRPLLRSWLKETLLEAGIEPGVDGLVACAADDDGFATHGVGWVDGVGVG